MKLAVPILSVILSERSEPKNLLLETLGERVGQHELHWRAFAREETEGI
jgi:hypothetical protein